jgi:hypothetical protein
MLPDYPKVKAELAAKLVDFLRHRVQVHLGPLSEISVRKVFEGDTQVLTRASGDAEEIPFQEMQASFAISDEELPNLTIPSLLVRLDGIAKELADQQARHTYAAISKTVEEVGNVVDAKGRSAAEALLETLSRLQIDFSPNGQARFPQIHIHPDLAKAMELAIKELETPEMKKVFNQVVIDKKEEWRAREASRKLVG